MTNVSGGGQFALDTAKATTTTRRGGGQEEHDGDDDDAQLRIFVMKQGEDNSGGKGVGEGDGGDGFANSNPKGIEGEAGRNTISRAFR